MHQVEPGLFLGNVEDARTHAGAFGAVVNVTPDFQFYGEPPYTLRIPVMDNGLENEALAPHLDGAVTFIHNHLSQHRVVLVHCAMGRQRSAAVVAAYLVRVRRMRVDDAVAFIKTRRPEAFFGGVNFQPSLDAYASYVLAAR